MRLKLTTYSSFLDTFFTPLPGESVGARRGGEAEALPFRGGGVQDHHGRPVCRHARENHGRCMEGFLARSQLPRRARQGGDDKYIFYVSM